MSADTVETLAKFSTQKCAGKFAVASAGPRVVAGYDVDIGKKVSINGSAPRQITSRTSYVIAPDGKIIYAHSDSEPEGHRSEEHTSELQSLMRISYAVFCLKKKNKTTSTIQRNTTSHNTISQAINTRN